MKFEFVIGFVVLVFALFRLVTMNRHKRRHILTAIWIYVRWPWIAVTLGLTLSVDRNRLSKMRVFARRGSGRYIRKPRIWPIPDPYGVKVRLWTLPGVGEAELMDKADALADVWRMYRVSVTQEQPGRLMVRAMRRDPLKEPVELESNPEGPTGMFMGMDEWGQGFRVNLAQVPGITVGGLPGKGKTTYCQSWIMQLVESEAVQLVVIDGKGGGDYEVWKDRCWRYVEDDMQRIRDVLREVYEHMRERQSWVRTVMGSRDGWKKGPTAKWPLILLVIDECHTVFKDKSSGDDGLAKACKFYVEEIIRKGRSVMMCTMLLTQKQTGDSTPTSIRDNCEMGICFAVRTKEAAVAALGDEIREWPNLNPANLQGEDYVGVAVVNDKRKGGFIRVRCPRVDEDEMNRVAEGSAKLRRNPVTLLADQLHEMGVSESNVLVLKRGAS